MQPGLLSTVCCVFRPSFGCCGHSKAGRNIFLKHLENYEKLQFYRAIFERDVEYRGEYMFRPAFGCLQHPKAGQNTQQLYKTDLQKPT